jgi:hypothetical protein
MRGARVAFAVAAAAGAALVVVLLATHAPSASTSAGELVRAARPRMTRPALRGMRADLERLEKVVGAIRDAALPTMGALAGETPEAFARQLRSEAPSFVRELHRFPAARALAEKVVANLERRRPQFRRAASLPGLGLTLHDATLVVIAAGAAGGLLGLAGALAPWRPLAVPILLAGLALGIGPPALGQPHDAAAADALRASLRPFSKAQVRERGAALATARAVVAGYRTRVLPVAARRAHAALGTLDAQVTAVSPELTRASLGGTGAALERLGALVAFDRRIQPLLVSADRVSARTTVWLTIGAGALLALASALALVLPRPPR